MARRKKDSLFEDLAGLPWPAGLIFGIGGYFFFAHTIFKPFALVVLLIGLVTAGLSALGAKHRRHLLDRQTGLESLRSMSWKEFELLVGEAYRRLGYGIEETGQGGADGGIDLLLRKDSVTTLVQCKQWRNQKIGVTVVREMYGLMVHHNAYAVRIVCTGSYSSEAEAFAKGKPIELIDGSALLRLIENLQTPAQDAKRSASLQPVPFLEKCVKLESATITAAPACPKCAATMVERTNRANGQAFWGCSKFPGCRGTVAVQRAP